VLKIKQSNLAANSIKCLACIAMAKVVVPPVAKTVTDTTPYISRAIVDIVALGNKPSGGCWKVGTKDGVSVEQLCPNPVKSPRTQEKNPQVETLVQGNQGSYISFDSEQVLFNSGKYKIINEDNFLAAIFKYYNTRIKQQLSDREQESVILYVIGSADITGRSFTEMLPNSEVCGAQQDFAHMHVHPLVRGSDSDIYSNSSIPHHIGPQYGNQELPELRSRSIQCAVQSQKPPFKVKILKGGIEPRAGQQYRSARLIFFIPSRPRENSVGEAPSGI
jgi:hypothetical protein